MMMSMILIYSQGLDPDDPASYRLHYEMAVVSSFVLTEAAVPELEKGSATAAAGTVVSEGSISLSLVSFAC